MNRRHTADDYLPRWSSGCARRGPTWRCRPTSSSAFPARARPTSTATLRAGRARSASPRPSRSSTARRPGTPAPALRRPGAGGGEGRAAGRAAGAARTQQAATFNAACVGADAAGAVRASRPPPRPARRPHALAAGGPRRRPSGLRSATSCRSTITAVPCPQPGRRRSPRRHALRRSHPPEHARTARPISVARAAGCTSTTIRLRRAVRRARPQPRPHRAEAAGEHRHPRQRGVHPGESEGDVRVAAAVLAGPVRAAEARPAASVATRSTRACAWRWTAAEARLPSATSGAVRTERKLVIGRARPTRPPICARCASTSWCSRSGPAGTGKTYLAVAMARGAAAGSGKVERIILSRPAVEAGERLGFLPGDLKEKVDPYLRPLYDALHDMLPAEQAAAAASRAARSRSRRSPSCAAARLRNAFVILDEAQNTTPIADEDVPDPPGRGLAHGRDRRSDPDRPAAGHAAPGSRDAVRQAGRRSQAVSVVRFDKKDVVRHPLVGAIVEAYETAARQAAQPTRRAPPAAGRGRGRFGTWTATVVILSR